MPNGRENPEKVLMGRAEVGFMFLKIRLLSGGWIIGARVQAGRGGSRHLRPDSPWRQWRRAESLMQVWFRMRASRPCRQLHVAEAQRAEWR